MSTRPSGLPDKIDDIHQLVESLFNSQAICVGGICFRIRMNTTGRVTIEFTNGEETYSASFRTLAVADNYDNLRRDGYTQRLNMETILYFARQTIVVAISVAELLTGKKAVLDSSVEAFLKFDRSESVDESVQDSSD